MEAERRLGSDWKIELEVHIFANADEGSPLASIDHHDVLTLRLSRFF